VLAFAVAFSVHGLFPAAVPGFAAVEEAASAAILAAGATAFAIAVSGPVGFTAGVAVFIAALSGPVGFAAVFPGCTVADVTGNACAWDAIAEDTGAGAALRTVAATAGAAATSCDRVTEVCVAGVPPDGAIRAIDAIP
jgi:hypothetical protein